MKTIFGWRSGLLHLGIIFAVSAPHYFDAVPMRDLLLLMIAWGIMLLLNTLESAIHDLRNGMEKPVWRMSERYTVEGGRTVPPDSKTGA